MKYEQVYNRVMAKRDKSEAECKEMEMSPASTPNRQANTSGSYDHFSDKYLPHPE
jgi:hypothetical protein